MDLSSAQPAASHVRVAVVIPALHRPDLTARCIESVLRQGLPSNDFEIIVVENDADHGPVLPNPFPPHVRQLLLTENLGFTGAINRGIEASSSEYALLLNNDVELGPEFLKLLLNRMESAPQAALAGGKLLMAAEHAVLDGAADALLLGGGAYRLGHGDPDQGQFNSADVLACCGAALLARRSVLDEVGGLDNGFFAYLDDVDLALRVRLRGHRVVYVPEACAYHVGSATLGDPVHPKMVEWITRNQIFLLIKNYPASLLLRLSPRIVVYQLLWMLRTISGKSFAAYLRGMWGVVRHMGAIWRERRSVQGARQLTSAELLMCLRESERQIASWQNSLPAERRSRLLSVYFELFGRARLPL